MAKDHDCQSCSWCHDFGTFGFCTNIDIKSPKDLQNRLTYEDLVTQNECPGFADNLWFGG
jgi:hypothetical protein